MEREELLSRLAHLKHQRWFPMLPLVESIGEGSAMVTRAEVELELETLPGDVQVLLAELRKLVNP